MLITSVSKLESVLKDIVTMQVSITKNQNDLKAIPVLKEKVKIIEEDLRQQKTEISSNKNTTAALETSVTNTQKDVDEFRDKIKELQTKMDENKALIKNFESKIVCLFVCGISLTSSQVINELFPDCTRSCSLQVVLRRRGGDRIYEMRCLFVAVGLNALFIVLPH